MNSDHKVDKMRAMKLDYFEDKLALYPEDSGPVFVDFTAGKKRHRLHFGGGKNQPLARAVGIQGNQLPTVIDATAGMGGDAFVLASLGCDVHMIERSDQVAALLDDALQRAKKHEDCDLHKIIERMRLTHANSATFLLTETPITDTVYMDPMYPEKKKKSAAKKEMKTLQALLGPDLDSQMLLTAALKTASLRVVVKRPAKAPPIEHLFQPTSSIKSPNTRYDIYVIKVIKSSKLFERL